MRQAIEDRVKLVANHIIEEDSTVREAAKVFGFSKSTIHKDLKYRLPKIDPILFKEVSTVMNHHSEIRSIRGGEATRNKFLALNRRCKS